MDVKLPGRTQKNMNMHKKSKLQVIMLVFFLLAFSLKGQIPDVSSYKRITSSPVTIENNTGDFITRNTDIYLEETIDPGKYIVGPGDKFSFNMLSSDGIISLLLTITPTGEILIPAVGVIFVDKLSLDVAIEKIKKMCLENYNNAKINISLISLRRFKIQISGAVNSPGFVNINPVSRLGDIINVVGGFHQLAKEHDIEIQRASGEKRYVNYTNFVINGDLDANPQFIEGDKIYVPFGNIEDEGIILRGAIKGKGYDIIQKGETLQNLLQRKIKLEQNADISNILITRENNDVKEVIVVSPKIFSSTILKPGDIIDFSEEKAVMVNGFVKVPGKYKFSPAFKAADYIGIAGGNLVDGDSKKVTIYHINGTIEVGQSITVQRGDILVVPQTRMSMFFGKLSLLELVSAVFTIYLAFLAAGA